MSDFVVLSAELTDAERSIETLVHSYRQAGQALLDIREKELWREGASFVSFEHYCEARWSMKKSRAYQLCDAGRFIREYAHSTTVENPMLPHSERHIRPLMKIKGADADQAWQKRVECWQMVQDEAANNNAQITEEFVESVVNRRFRGGDKVKPKKPVTLGNYTNAFGVIHGAGYTPEEAVEKFGSPSDWAGFYDALKWMESAHQIDVEGVNEG